MYPSTVDFNQNTGMINVKQYPYGARGDGVTDDTVAIQAAIDSSTGPLVIYFPSGNYIISSSLIIDRNSVTLWGVGGCFNTQITVAPTADPSYGLIIGNTANANFCIVNGLTFKGRKDASTIGKGILLRGSRCSIKQCFVEQFGGNGLTLDSFSGHTNDCQVEDTYLEQNGFNSSLNAHNMVITSNVFDCEYRRVISSGTVAKDTTYDGFNNAGTNQKFIGCHSFYSRNFGFNHIGGPFEMVAGASETNNIGNIRVSGVNDWSISNLQCYAVTTGGSDIVIITGTRWSISNCRCTSVTTDKNIKITSSSAIGNITGLVTQNGTNPLQIDNTCTRININGSQFQASANLLVGAQNCIINNNFLIGPSCSIAETTGADNNQITHNTLFNPGTITKIGTNSVIRFNKGFVTENYGTASITSGNTSIVVSHGLGLTPSINQISVTPQTTLSSATFFWISNVTSTQFTINLNTNPGATVTFGWQIETGF